MLIPFKQNEFVEQVVDTTLLLAWQFCMVSRVCKKITGYVTPVCEDRDLDMPKTGPQLAPQGTGSFDRLSPCSVSFIDANPAEQSRMDDFQLSFSLSNVQSFILRASTAQSPCSPCIGKHAVLEIPYLSIR